MDSVIPNYLQPELMLSGQIFSTVYKFYISRVDSNSPSHHLHTTLDTFSRIQKISSGIRHTR